ncbi:piggyBac transposable element-derived protein 4-like [Amphiura filiformis]|uniref:piggyBac transposable element-derived protein 4-like n=1 Tax=Amphiura filiformis TaxID=82378 RepID=UPI003B21C17F
MRPTRVEEILAFFGLRVLMGLSWTANYKDYWSCKHGIRNELICETMTRTRFEHLTSNLACTFPDENPNQVFRDNKVERKKYKDAHPLWPLQSTWDAVRAACQDKTHYQPRRELSLDEAMIGYKGNKSWVKKMWLKGKPTPWGFKCYVIAEAATGFAIELIMHPNEKITISDLVKQVSAPILDENHHIFADRYFNKAELARWLLSRNTYLTGPVKEASKGFPVDFISKAAKNPTFYKRMKALQDGDRGCFHMRQSGQLTATAWKDRRVIVMMSSAHQPQRDADDFVMRTVQGHGKCPVPAPPHVVDYNQFMGGVDRSDQLREYYSCSRKTQQWWRHILTFLIDIARVNAYVCAKEHRPRLKQRDFCHSLAIELIGGFSEGSARALPPFLQRVPAGAGGHYMTKMPGNYPRSCANCRLNNIYRPCGKRPRSSYGCTTCNQYLCRDHCFVEYHSL